LFIHPQGLLTAGDDQGRAYCWDIEQLAAASPAQRPVAPLWLSGERVMLYAGCVAFGDCLATYGNGNVTTLAIADGKQQWRYPDLLPLLGGDGIVESQDGVIVRWSLAGEVVALNAADGALLWKISMDSRPFRAIVDDGRSRLYITRGNELLECRDLHSGVLQWSYSWSDLVSDADRQRLAKEHGLQRVVVWPADLMVGPDGIWLALLSGDVLSITADGKPLWHVRLSTPLIGGLGFANGLLLGEVYLGEDMLRHPLYGPLMSPFNPAPPDWAIVRNASAAELKGGMFFRFAVLDLRDGHQLDSFEVGAQPDILPSPTPAGEMIVFGYRDAPGTERSVVLSYNWLQGGTG
jgi:outer membrane protein assembly factor BamB